MIWARIEFKIYIDTFIHRSTVVLIRVQIYTIIDPGPDRVKIYIDTFIHRSTVVLIRVRIYTIIDPGPDRG